MPGCDGKVWWLAWWFSILVSAGAGHLIVRRPHAPDQVHDGYDYGGAVIMLQMDMITVVGMITFIMANLSLYIYIYI